MSGNAFNSDDLSLYCKGIFNRLGTLCLRGGFAGDLNDCDLLLTSHADTDQVTNSENYIKVLISYTSGGGSIYSCLGIDNNVERPVSVAGGNLRIQGLAEPQADNDLANKAYTDSTMGDSFFTILDPAKALVTDVINGLGGYVANPNGLEITVNTEGPFSNAVNGGFGVGSVDVDGYTLPVSNDNTSAERILFTNVTGNGSSTVQNPSAMNGVYVLTNVAAGVLTFIRSSDLDTIALPGSTTGIQQGDYVIIRNSGSSHSHGIGFFLNSSPSALSNADGPTTNQNWQQFAAFTVPTFTAVLHNDPTNQIRLRGDIGGADENRPLLAGDGATSGKAVFADRMGRSDTAFIIQGTTTTIGESGVTTDIVYTDGAAANFTVPNTGIVAGGTDAIDFVSNLSLKFNGETHDVGYYQNIFEVAKISTGSVPFVYDPGQPANTLKYDAVQGNGPVGVRTTQFDDADANLQVGCGVLLDAATVPGTMANDQEGRFFLAASKVAGAGSDECRFHIYNFANGTGNANPLITFI